MPTETVENVKTDTKQIIIHKHVEDTLTQRELELMSIYGPNGEQKDRWGRPIKRSIVPGSIRKEDNTGKLQIEVQCQWKGCTARRLIYTSDLHQTRFCEEHQKEIRNVRRRKTGKIQPNA